MNGWINAEKQLPTNGETVAIAISLGEDVYLRTGWHRDSGEWFQSGLGIIEGKVIYWMHLPELPKEG